MKISDFLNIIKKNKEEYPKDDFFINGHKPYNIYINIVNNDATVEELFRNIDKLIDIFKQKFKPNTIRNYCKYLQVSLHLNVIKELFTNEQITTINLKIDKVLQEIDKLKTLSSPREGLFIHSESINESIIDEIFDINEIVPIDSIDSIKNTTIENSSSEILEKIKILKNTFLLYVKSKEDDSTYMAWKNIIDYIGST